ncbi:MAG: SRPBCC family protein [Methyloceanibacter sp.]|uniref:SRPBCC family protein n=1 Tax=Methyloceanibacter sp. TaxID=1965321 RepID=UPI003D6D4A04
MASIRREEIVEVPADKAWSALRDVGRPHALFADVLVDGSIDGDIRTVTFANGMVVRERIVDIDEASKRVAYAVIDGVFEHHSASMQIVPDGEGRCRFVWVSDFLPNEKMALVAPLVESGATALVRNLETAG